MAAIAIGVRSEECTVCRGARVNVAGGRIESVARRSMQPSAAGHCHLFRFASARHAVRQCASDCHVAVGDVRLTLQFTLSALSPRCPLVSGAASH